jgi:hypothetical protein
MQSQELIRAAAAVIRNGGWSQGTAARDAMGNEVPLFGGTRGDASRAGVNPEAVSFSIYGALVKAMGAAGSGVADPGMMWETLRRMSGVEHGVPAGGLNHVHSVITYNDGADRTVEQVLSFLETCALTIEAKAEGGA